MTRKALSILIHADTKVGKSTFANTAPAPRLLLDAEAAYRFLPGVKVFWDPMSETPPKPGAGRVDPLSWDITEVDWETCVVIVRDYTVIIKAYEWLNSGQHEFVSVILDSISEIQKKCKDNMRSLDEAMDMRKWGALLDHMEWLIRGLRDLTEHPTRPLQAVVLTSMTTQRDGKWRPYVQGQLAVTMPYFLDIIGYMYAQEVPNEDPSLPAKKMRRMLVSPHAQFEAGGRAQEQLGDVIDNPTVTEMLNKVFGNNERNSA